MVSLHEFMYYPRSWQSITFKQPVETVPRHIPITGTPVKPLAPRPFNLFIVPVKAAHVKCNPIKAVMTMHFSAESLPLFLYRVVAMHSAPLIYLQHCRLQLLLRCLALNHPVAFP